MTSTQASISNSSRVAPTAFAITQRELDAGTSVISAEGELDLSTAPRLQSIVNDSLERDGGRLIVDLSLTTFIDSTGLSVLLAATRRLDPDGPLAIVCTHDNVLKIFEFSGTDGSFAIYPTLDEALAHAREHAARAG
jgi:anti-sigma B factor antagonist